MDAVVTLSLTATLVFMTCGQQLNAETLQIGTYVGTSYVLFLSCPFYTETINVPLP